MRVRKGESHRALLIPVLLVLAAAFLATSLGSFDGNDITGAQTFSKNRIGQNCEWVEKIEAPGAMGMVVSTSCPNNKPTVYGGGCKSPSGGELQWSYPEFRYGGGGPGNHSTDSWGCGFNSMNRFHVAAFCCK